MNCICTKCICIFYISLQYNLPHHQDLGKVFYTHNIIHRNYHYIYLLDSLLPCPKIEDKSKRNYIKSILFTLCILLQSSQKNAVTLINCPWWRQIQILYKIKLGLPTKVSRHAFTIFINNSRWRTYTTYLPLLIFST